MSTGQRLQNLLTQILLVALLVTVVGLVLLQANPLMTGPSLDGGYYLYVGQQIAHGQVPYRDVWESKPPAIFYLNALALILGHGTRWGLWAIEFLFLFGAALVGWWVMRRAYGMAPALAGTLAWLWGMNALFSGGNYTEEFSLLFSFLAILAFWKARTAPSRAWDFLVGLSGAVAFLFRANNVGIQVAVVLAWGVMAVVARDGRSLLRRLLWSGLGAGVVLGLVGAFLAVQGVLGEAINAAVLYNFYLTGEHTNPFSSLAQGLLAIGLPAGLVLAGYLALVNTQVEQRALAPLHLLFLIDLPLEVALSGLSGRNYLHYFIPWLPAVGFLSAFLFFLVTTRLNQWFARFAWPLLLAGLIALLAFSPQGVSAYQQTFQRLAFERQKGTELDNPVASYIRAHTTPDERVLIWGSELGLDFMARRQEPTAFIFYPLYVDSPFTARLSNGFYSDLTQHPPVLIVDSYPSNPDLLPALDASLRREQFRSGKVWPWLPDNVTQVFGFIEGHYHLETTIDSYRIYRYTGDQHAP